MNPQVHAIRVGLRRGWTEALLALRSPADLIYLVFWGGGVFAYLYLNRDTAVEGTDLLLPALVLPGALATMVVFGGVVAPSLALVVEREDGTLLRAKAAPYGMIGYVTGQVLLQVLSVVLMLVVLLVPSAILLDGLAHMDAARWAAAAGFLVLGLVASLPIGLVIGSLARKPNHATTWGFLPVVAVTAISGVFTPITDQAPMWQGVAQVFPIYWLGTALRWAFLPDSAASLELGGVWHTGQAAAVLTAWAVVGLLVTPGVLRRMARRESGSAVEARMADRMQRIA